MPTQTVKPKFKLQFKGYRPRWSKLIAYYTLYRCVKDDYGRIRSRNTGYEIRPNFEREIYTLSYRQDGMRHLETFHDFNLAKNRAVEHYMTRFYPELAA